VLRLHAIQYAQNAWMYESHWTMDPFRSTRTVLADPEMSRLSEVGGAGTSWLVNGSRSDTQPEYLLTLDPHEHTRLRKVVTRSLTGARLEGLRPRANHIAQELFDAWRFTSASSASCSERLGRTERTSTIRVTICSVG